jgi:hypothetical protein
VSKTTHQKKIEFVFPDRMLAYDCATCQDNCCNGNGFALEAQTELVQILSTYPALGPFLGSGLPSKHDVRVQNFRSGCYFLDPENLCTIEREMGRETKPLLCRLFPVNKLFVCGDSVLVDVHDLCTLGLEVYGGPSARAIAHGAILDEFSESIRSTVEREPRDHHETNLAPFADRVLSLGRSIRDRAKNFFELGDFHGYLLFQSEQTARELPPDCDRRVLHPPLDGASIERMHERMAAFFGLHSDHLGEAGELRLNRILIATSCSVRQRFLVAGAPAIGTARDFYRTVTLLPWILVALEFLYRTALTLNPERNAVSVVNDIYTKQFALLRALATFLRWPAFTGALPPKLDLPPALKKPFFDFLKHLAAPQQAIRPRTFHELLESLELPAHDRASLLRALDAHGGAFVDWCPSQPATPSPPSRVPREVRSNARP